MDAVVLWLISLVPATWTRFTSAEVVRVCSVVNRVIVLLNSVFALEIQLH